MIKMQKIKIYVDGACSLPIGHGGWAAILEFEDDESDDNDNFNMKEIRGKQRNTTNNQMELTAPIKALQSLSSKSEIKIVTDSQYVKNGITSWIFNWQKNNWRTAGRTAVKNKELWQELLAETKNHDVQWEWVKAHNNHPKNERADQLAKMGVDELKNG